MGDSGRRRGSVRDVVDEDLPPYSDRGRYREYSALPHNNLPRPRHHSRWSNYEEKDETIMQDNVDMGETRDPLHNSGYDRNMSPDLDGLEHQWRNTQDKQRSESRRYGERSRSRGLEKSRSRSPGRSRGRIPVRDRSRSRSKGSIRGHSRSRSPFYDQGSQSRRGGDRKSGHGRSSQPLDSDTGGRWKGKQESGHGSKYHYDKAADKFSDAYYRENEPSRRPRGGVTCKDFVKGSCRYGESCRFSHSTESDNADKSFRDVRVDPDHGYNSNKTGRSLCKFFLAGNCQRDNCRFSHDTPLSSEIEDRIHDKSGGETAGTLNGWSGPLWDEPEKSVKISKWGESLDADMDLSEDVSACRRGDARWGCSLEDETKAWGHENKGINRDNYHSNNRNDENSRHIVAAMTMVNENSPGEPQQNLSCNEFSSHSADKIAPHSPNHNLGGEAGQHYLSPPSANPQVSMTSATYQYQGMPEHNRGPVLESGILHELKGCRNTNVQTVSPEIRSAFCDNSSLLKMEDQQMLSPISNVLKDDLNESGHAVSPSNVNEQINWQQSTIQNMPDPSAHSSFSVQAPIEQFDPLNTSPMPVSNVQNIAAVHVAKSFLEEFKTQLHTVLEPSTLMTLAPAQKLLHPAPTNCPQSVTNSTKSLDQHPPLNNDPVYAANDQKARELLSSLSMINPQLNNLHQSGDSKVKDNDNSKKNLHEATQKVEASDKIEANNNCSNRADDQGKDDGGGNNKDEKVIRLFKNALVELVKDILKPKWKEGKMSREVHKTVVKKVVDKVTVAIPAEHVPKTQEKVEQYLSSNRPKISKLVQAYVERSLKANS